MRLVAFASLLILTGCSLLGLEPSGTGSEAAAPAPSGEKVAVTKATMAAFENYKYWLTPIAWSKPMGEGYFAVAKDGRSWGLTGCTANACIAGAPQSQDAVDICQTRSGGVPCIVFARDQDIIVPYDVID
ncbi:MAG TPA: hypothetical protein VHA35_18885 [Dongiaceae bacterium]|nr:hypothetical protein [Dongiaceae bacterium]